MSDDDHDSRQALPAHACGASAAVPAGFRSALTLGEDIVDVTTWAGSVPAVNGVAPRVRVGSRWLNLLWLLPRGFVLLLGGVAVAKGLRNTAPVQRFIANYRGTDPHADRAGDYLGVPSWARWQHLFNLLFLLFILRSGADSHRPSTAVLDAALHPRAGLVQDAEAGTRRPAVDGEAGLD